MFTCTITRTSMVLNGILYASIAIRKSSQAPTGYGQYYYNINNIQSYYIINNNIYRVYYIHADGELRIMSVIIILLIIIMVETFLPEGRTLAFYNFYKFK